MVSWLQGGAAQLASMLFGVACEFFAAWDGAAKQQPCDLLLVGSQVVMFQGVGVQASPCGFRARYVPTSFSVQGSAPCTQRVRPCLHPPLVHDHAVISEGGLGGPALPHFGALGIRCFLRARTVSR